MFSLLLIWCFLLPPVTLPHGKLQSVELLILEGGFFVCDHVERAFQEQENKW